MKLHKLILPIERKEKSILKANAKDAAEYLRLQIEGVYQRLGYTWDQDVYFSQRQRILRWHLTNCLGVLSEQIETSVLSFGEQAFRIGYYLSSYLLGLDNFVRPSQQYILGILNQPYINATVYERISDLETQYVSRFRKALVNSQIESDSLPQALSRIRQMWGLSDESGYFGAVIRIQSGELWRAANRGAMEAIRDHQELISSVSWDTAENERVCKICNPLHGKSVDYGEAFHIGRYDTQFAPIHIGCKCTVYPIVKNPPKIKLLDWLRLNFITNEESGGLGA